jgi:ABC-type Na+ transport system ATPase subunit NatA
MSKKARFSDCLDLTEREKTTTIRMLVGLARPTTGQIAICGHDIQADHRNALQQIGTIVENPELYPYLSGLENLRQFARLSGPVDETKITEIVMLLTLVGTIAMCTLGFFCSVLVRSAAVSTGISIAVIIIGTIIIHAMRGAA